MIFLGLHPRLSSRRTFGDSEIGPADQDGLRSPKRLRKALIPLSAMTAPTALILDARR
jgi:hypothetical protein